MVYKLRAVSVRASDLFGPHVAEVLTGAQLFGPALVGKRVQLLANPDLPHSLSYIRTIHPLEALDGTNLGIGKKEIR